MSAPAQAPTGTTQHAHLLAFLGIGEYRRTTYRTLEGAEHVSAYCPVAIAQLHDCAQTVLLATERAQQIHGDRIEADFRALGRALRIERIPLGSTEQEMRALFETLRREALAVAEDTALFIDLTHGFRTQPFFAGLLLQYLQALKPALAARTRLLYGAFEARQGDSTSVWDLTAYTEAAALNAALHMFLCTGQAAPLADRLEVIGRVAAKQWAADRQGRRPLLDTLARTLRFLSAALDAVRIGELLLPAGRNTPSLVRRVLQAIDDAQAAGLDALPMLGEPLQRLRERLALLTFEEDHLAGSAAQPALASLARLYLDWGRLPEAAIVLREGWICLHAPEAAARPGERFDERARSDAERRFGSQAASISMRIGDIRNDIEHGGFRRKPLPADTIRNRLRDEVEVLANAIAPAAQPARAGNTWFVTRHPGAVQWARRHGYDQVRVVAHLDVEVVAAGDTVIGTLPVNLAAEVCRRRARFLNLSLDLPPEARGRELSADELEAYGARIEEYAVTAVGAGADGN